MYSNRTDEIFMEFGYKNPFAEKKFLILKLLVSV